MRRIALTALAVLMVTGCQSRTEQSDTEVRNEIDAAPSTVPKPANVVVAPLPAPSIASNTIVRAEPPPPVDDTEQTRADADASGMTSRLPDADRDQPATAPVANSTETK